MVQALRHIWVWCCGVGLLVVFASPAAAGGLGKPAAAEWLPPTPTEGQRFRVGIGERLRLALVATTRAAPESTVTIEASSVPAGATFRTTAGNPAGATVTWTPTKGQAGRRFSLTFTADPDDPGIDVAKLHVTVEVRAPATTFTLSSRATETYRYAFVMRRVVARAAPNRGARPVARLLRLTPERTTNLVLALEGRRTPRAVWIRVRLPILPNNTTGWVPRRALSDWKVLRTHLVVDRGRLTATLYRLGKPVFFARVGIGKPQWPTPAGEFYVRNQLYGYNDPFFGPIAFGTNARSAVLTDWPGGGFIGIHGTNQPQLIPGRVSHGCIRLRNRDVLRLARLMPVGTPLTVL
jgi:lipoprotein-anchoring transpeptidase ErfK/SrfK